MSDTMRAIGAPRGLPIDDPGSLVDVELPAPEPRPRDVLVEVRAVSVNPVDVKVRATLPPSTPPRILGYDAAGIVRAVGTDVRSLAVGDEVWYAGDITRPGSDAELQAVDERIVSERPGTLDFAQAAALPLTAITAWESLFGHLRLGPESRGTLLVLGAAGGVGSIAVQLAKALTGVRVVGTASRSASHDWVCGLGADAVIDHHDLVNAATRAVPDGVDWLLSTNSAGHVEDFAEIMAPFGHIVAIDDPDELDVVPLKDKALTWHWELMFARPMYETEDMVEQKHLLARVAELVDAGRLRTTATQTIEEFSAAGLRQAHAAVESGRTIGKVVVAR